MIVKIAGQNRVQTYRDANFTKDYDTNLRISDTRWLWLGTLNRRYELKKKEKKIIELTPQNRERMTRHSTLSFRREERQVKREANCQKWCGLLIRTEQALVWSIPLASITIRCIILVTWRRHQNAIVIFGGCQLQAEPKENCFLEVRSGRKVHVSW